MAEPSTDRIFLSYRREETEHAAGRLGDWIAVRFGRSRLFMDVDSIPPGADFVDAIQRAVGDCHVLLAMIGPRWTTVVDDRGRRRLDDPEDFVVLELRAALVRDVPVIPVLVDGAVMPKRAELPPDLEPLTRRNAVRLDAETFRQDSEWLLDQLATMIRADTGAAAPSTTPPFPAVGDARSGLAADVKSTAKPASGGPLWSTLPVSRRTVLRLAAGALTLGASGTAAWRLSRPGGSDESQPIWSFMSGGEVYSSPEVVGGVVYVGSRDQHLYAIDMAEGRQIWRYATGDAVTSSPTVVDGMVYVGSNDTKVHAVATATGMVRWTFDTPAAMHSSPTVDDGVLYIGCRNNSLYAIGIDDGDERWRFSAGDWFNSSPVVAGGTVYVGCRDNNVYAIDAHSGEMRWSYTTNSSVDSSAAVSGDTLWIGSDDHRVYALNARTGGWIWDFDAEQGVVSTPFVADDVLYVGSDDGNLYALDATTGRERWRYSTGNSIRSSPTVADGIVYVGSRDFSLYAIDAQTGERVWRFKTGGPIDDSSPVVLDGRVFVGSLDHRIYALEASSAADS